MAGGENSIITAFRVMAQTFRAERNVYTARIIEKAIRELTNGFASEVRECGTSGPESVVGEVPDVRQPDGERRVGLSEVQGMMFEDGRNKFILSDEEVDNLYAFIMDSGYISREYHEGIHTLATRLEEYRNARDRSKSEADTRGGSNSGNSVPDDSASQSGMRLDSECPKMVGRDKIEFDKAVRGEVEDDDIRQNDGLPVKCYKCGCREVINIFTLEVLSVCPEHKEPF